MFGVITYYKTINTLLSGMLILSLFARVATNMLYGHFCIDNPQTQYDNQVNEFWADVYYKGQAFFELSVLFFSAVMARRHFSKYVQVCVNFFFGLCLFSWVKEYFLNPLQWQPGEYAGFWFGMWVTLAELVVVKLKITIQKFTHYLKLLFK